jgi:hypothetical protein
MNFPITRETLQSYDYAKLQEDIRNEEMQKRFANILDDIRVEFKKTLPQNIRIKRFVWSKLNIVRGISNVGSNDYIPQLIDKLKEIFIGCDIIVDPLQTYLIIDWS